MSEWERESNVGVEIISLITRYKRYYRYYKDIKKRYNKRYQYILHTNCILHAFYQCSTVHRHNRQPFSHLFTILSSFIISPSLVSCLKKYIILKYFENIIMIFFNNSMQEIALHFPPLLYPSLKQIARHKIWATIIWIRIWIWI